MRPWGELALFAISEVALCPSVRGRRVICDDNNTGAL
jgi:hypothetical protein